MPFTGLELQALQQFLPMLTGGGGDGEGGSSQGMAAMGMPSEMFKTALGIGQAIQANKFAKMPRPEYTIPGAIQEATGTARQLANTGLPGYDLMRGNLGAATAAGVRSIKEVGGSGPEKMAAIAGMAGDQMAQSRALDIENANQKVQNLRNLQSQLGVHAQYQDKAWGLNKQQPWQEAMEAAARLKDAANTNIYGGMKGMGAAAGLMGGGEGGGAETPKTSLQAYMPKSEGQKTQAPVFTGNATQKPVDIFSSPTQEYPANVPLPETPNKVTSKIAWWNAPGPGATEIPNAQAPSPIQPEISMEDVPQEFIDKYGSPEMALLMYRMLQK